MWCSKKHQENAIMDVSLKLLIVKKLILKLQKRNQHSLTTTVLFLVASSRNIGLGKQALPFS
uniref:Uncharacterized protein n=1 Tax=Oryza sativa subsp. japonica TaxID=39947 RepID=Q6F2S8_ORYSJ|nr:hypothetical protein [Oryza sativa Japonica Group]